MMKDVCPVETALQVLIKQMSELRLPEQAEKMTVLAGQQQQLLEAYFMAVDASQIDQELIRGVLHENHRFLTETKRALANTSEQLDALAMRRNAVSAYAGAQPKPQPERQKRQPVF